MMASEELANVDVLRDRAINYLRRNALLHIGMIDPILRGTVDILYAKEDGVFLKELKSQVYMMSVDSLETGRRFLDAMEACPFVELFQPYMIEEIRRRFGFSEVMECRQAVYTKSDRLPVDTDLEIRRLSPEWYDQVYAHYDNLSERDLMQLLEDGAVFGGFCDGKLAGFIGNHLEGSIGLLEIFPEYQRRGYGEALECFMVNRTLENEGIPYTQIVVGNEASMRLQKKLGFEVTEETLFWLDP